MEENDGITLSSRIIHSGKVFTAVNEHIELPTGRHVELDIIRHNRSVVLLPMPDSNHIVLVRQYRTQSSNGCGNYPQETLKPMNILTTLHTGNAQKKQV